MLKFCHSVKSPKDNEWIMDPVTIADVYGPEVKHSYHNICPQVFLRLHGYTA